MTNTHTQTPEALAYWFGTEWADLSIAGQSAVLHDYSSIASLDDRREYRRNIGAGNLSSYADCLLVAAVKAWIASDVQA